MYAYHSQQPVWQIPETSPSFLPPAKYLASFYQSDFKSTYLMTDFYSFYGCVRLNRDDTFVIIGPATPIAYSREILSMMRREFLVAEHDTDCFSQTFSAIPLKELSDFLSMISFINFSLNQDSSQPECLNAEYFNDSFSLLRQYVTQQYQDKESGIHNNTWEIESVICHNIETGNVKALEDFLQSEMTITPGTMGSNFLIQTKFGTVSSISVACRAAIRAGLDSDTAFRISDIYIQQVENISSIPALHNLSAQVFFKYASLVSELIHPANENCMLDKAMTFIRNNTNRKISVADVADHVGYSRAYLSHQFKQKLGFGANEFILRCKLEEARELLKYTEHSLVHISNYLGFSSQSRFQTVFKEQYGITPKKYREQN